MKCENCKAIVSYFDGEETVTFCKCGISEDKAYNSNTDTWGCRLCEKTINKRIEEYDNCKTKF